MKSESVKSGCIPQPQIPKPGLRSTYRLLLENIGMENEMGLGVWKNLGSSEDPSWHWEVHGLL